MCRKSWVAVLVALAVVALTAGPASAVGVGGVARDLYLVATDGYMWLPSNGDPGALGCGVMDRPAGLVAGFNANQDPLSPGYCKTWIRGFAAANGPLRDPAERAASGAWKPPIDRLGRATIPAPIVDVGEGDDVFLHLANIGNKEPMAPSDPHTIHLHGQAVTTQNDGFPETSWVVPVGAQVVYYFFAENAGSYMYHCHVEASEHVQMGMYGALLIRPKGFAAYLAAGKPSVFQKTNFGTPRFNDEYNANTLKTKPLEYVFLLGDVDMTWHEQVRTLQNPASAAAQFKQDFWLVNGRSFPDTIGPQVVTKALAPNPLFAAAGPEAGSPFLARAATGAAGTCAFGQCAGDGPPDGYLPGANNYADYGTILEAPNFGGAVPPRILVRYIDISYVSSPMHFHGWHFVTVGIDAQPVPRLSQKEEFTVNGASGKTYELIITATARDSVNLPGSLYGANSNPLATGQAWTGGALPATPVVGANGVNQVFAAGTAPEMGPLPTGLPQAYNITGLSVPGVVASLAGIQTGAGFVEPGALDGDGVTPLAGTYSAVTGSVPAMLPAGAAAQLSLISFNQPAFGTPDPVTGILSGCPPNPVSGIPTCPAPTINTFTVPNNILDLWYPSHDHNDFKVTNYGLYPGGAIVLIWAHSGPALLK